MKSNINTNTMKTHYNLEISTPCSENFNEFKPTAKGGFCDSCHKEVIDFTKFKNDEIASYFKSHSSQNTCGRFTAEQLNRTYETSPLKKKYYSYISGIAMAFLSFFSINSAQAQEAHKTTDTKKDDTNSEEIKNLANITVEGTVFTEEDGLPLPGCSVVLQGSTHGAQTDFDGYFKFPVKLKKGDVLLICYVGMKTKKVIITNPKSATKINLEADMSLDDVVIVGEVAVKELFKSKKN